MPVQMATGSASLVFVGTASWDSIALVSRFPQPDERLVAEDVVYAGGGPAATAAVAAARLGAAAAFVGTVGDDEQGRRIVGELAAEGVDTSGVSVSPGRSCASVVVVDRVRGTRAICNRPGPRVRVDGRSPAETLVRNAGWVHVDQAGWPVVRARIDGGAFKLSVDDGNVIPDLDLSAVDLHVPTLDALTKRYGARPADELADQAVRDGALTVVVTCGRDGSFAVTTTGERHHVATPDVEVVSTLGAGDVFHGALLAAVSRGMRLEASLRYATTAATLSCRGVDGRSAIPGHDEAIRHMTAAVY